MNRFARNTAAIACIILAIGVVMGAFGAHALKEVFNPGQLQSWETATRYQIYGGLSALILALFYLHIPSRLMKAAIVVLIAGTLLFSLSIYLLTSRVVPSLSGILGPVTPIGGLFIILAWGMAAFAFIYSGIKSK